MASHSTHDPPNSILVIGAGVFGLSTTYALLTDPIYDGTHITILDAYVPAPDHNGFSNPTFHTSSLDSSRIIRPDYANSAYARLAERAQRLWRAGWPLTLDNTRRNNAQQPYHESSLLLTSYAHNPVGGKYVDDSLANILNLEEQSKPRKRSRRLDTTAEVSKALGTGGCTGAKGYINPNSGWADAEGATALLRQQVQISGQRRGRVEWIQGRAKELIYEERNGNWEVTGAKLDEGRALFADVTILSAGAWSPALLPRSLGRRVKGRGQVLAYVDISEEEHKQYGGLPVALELSGGMFVIFPRPAGEKPASGSSTKPHVKVARHGWGYEHTVRVPDSEPPRASDDARRILPVDIPAPTFSPIPVEGQAECRAFLRKAVPKLDERPFSNARLCWYADTATGDFIIDYVPQYGKSLLVATGGSGHGFKFTPVIGELIVKRLKGHLGANEDSSVGLREVTHKATEDQALEQKLANIWRWRTDEEVREEWKLGGGDGSRGGRKGMVWEDEFKKNDGKGKL